MSVLESRKKSLEEKHRRNKELDFKVQARRNKLLGVWAAEKLGLSNGAADAYVKEVIASDFDEPGDQDVLRKVHNDLQNNQVDINEHMIRREMDNFLEIARKQLTE